MGYIDDASGKRDIQELWRAIRGRQTQSDLGNSSITEGRLRVASNEGLVVEGSQKVSGWLIVTGTLKVVGTLLMEGFLTITGNVTATGIWNQNGPWNLAGTGGITGDVSSTGAWTQSGTYTVNSPGKIVVAGGTSPATLENGALSFGTGAKLEADGAGARLISGTGPRLYVFPASIGVQCDPTHYVQVTSGGVTVKGGLSTDTLSTSSSKQFAIPHPTKPGMTLRHGSTESPVSGIEYWGDATLDESGRVDITLPAYFEALAKSENRTVFITARGFAADWTDIEDGAFAVTGRPGGQISWQVKAERRWADFETEDATGE